ncbi:hypothetical protein [Histophilus somni]|uniref:hypothetical protein n=1 Tax=Histophilus somni TaxID=731 RepID=UPI0010492BC8|nr:hypothetical protein [Histophilus somni]TDF37777.1 hypothetical protein E1290_07680 [Histophilus somni]TFF02170.1 hypothetical protein E3U35_03030 [Histophilus somni]TJY52836.1 hypothetical protein FAZ28_03185 [Histophilus somni]
MGFINDAGGGTARNIRDIDRDRDRDRDRGRNNSYDTKSLDNLAKAIHDGSYKGKNDSRWSRGKDGYSSFGSHRNHDDNYSSYSSNYAGSYSKGKSAIGSAVQNHRNLVANSPSDLKSKTLTGENVDDGLLSSNQNKQYSPIDYAEMYKNGPRHPIEKATLGKREMGPMSRIAPEDPHANSYQNYRYVQSLANKDWIEDTQRSIAGNAVGGISSSGVANAVAGAVGGGLGRAVAGAVAGIAASNAGDLANMAVGKANKEGLTDEQKAMYDQVFSQRKDYFDKRRRSFDSFGNGIATVLGTGVDIASKGLTMGAGSTIADAYKNNSALEKTLENFDSPENRQFLKERQEAYKRAREEDAKRRKADGSNKGILYNMTKRLQPQEEPQEPTLPYYAIPALTNLWNNVIVK